MRYQLFDGWRFIAALAVMLYHFAAYGPPLDAAWVYEAARRLQGVMDLFFLLSGFMVMLFYRQKVDSPAGTLRFLGRRLARLYPLHLITLGFYLLVGLGGALGVIAIANPQRYDPSAILPNLLLLHAWGTTQTLTFNYVSWSLSAELFCYLMFPALAWIARRHGAPGLVIALFAAWGLVEGASAAGLLPTRAWIDGGTVGAFTAAPAFVLGCLAAVSFERSTLRVGSLWPAILLSLAACIAMALDVPRPVVLPAFALSAFLAAVAERAQAPIPAGVAVLARLGAYSFAIYIIHPVFASLAFSAVWNRWLSASGLVSFWAWLAIVMAAVVTVAVPVALFVERPLQRALLARLDRRRPAALPAEAA